MLDDSENIYFTELYEHNLKISAVLSPNGNFIANAVKSELHILDVDKKEVSQKFICDCKVDFVKWSPDSELICCGKLKESLQIWNLNIPHWRCKITGNLSFHDVHWSPYCQNIIVVSEFCVRATIFSLVSSVVAEIDHLKAIDNGFAFSPCKKYLIASQRKNHKDFITVYCCQTWGPLKVFPTETKDFVAVSFSPKDLIIAVLDSSVEYRVLFYSLDGRLLGKFVLEGEFGLLSANWCSGKNLIALGDCWSEVKILNSINYDCVTSYQHSDVIESSDIIVYRIRKKLPEVNNPSVLPSTSYFELDEVAKCRPISLSSINDIGKNQKAKNPLKPDVLMLHFSSDGKYIATVVGIDAHIICMLKNSTHMPNVVFIYNVEKQTLYSIIERASTIKSLCWHPIKPYLVVSSSSNAVDVWTPESCVRCIPTFNTDFPIINAVWSPKCNLILLNSKDKFSILFFELGS